MRKLEKGIGHGPAGRARQIGHPVHLALRLVPGGGVVGLKARHQLEQTAPTPAQRISQREQLTPLGESAGHRLALRRAVAEDARGRHAERAGGKGVINGLDHDRELVIARLILAVQTTVAHGIETQRTVADHAADVDTLRHRVKGVVVLAIGLPVPGQAGHDGVGRNVLHRFHQPCQLLVIGRPHRREGHAAIADHHRGHAVPARRTADRIPGELRVEVAVDVDKAWCDQTARRVDAALRTASELAYLGDAPVDDGDVGAARRRAAAVHHRAVLDQDVVAAHGCISCAWLMPAAVPALKARRKCRAP